MKKVLSLIISVFITSAMYGQTSVAPTSGNGSSTNPYQIASLENLYWLSQTSSVWGSYFIQTTDIDASATSTWDSGKGFSPIGPSQNSTFHGSYDGQGHTITGLTINRTSTVYVGMFGWIGFNNTTSVVENLGLVNSFIAGSYNVGAFAGELYTATIQNCYNTGTVTAPGGSVGGIVGVGYDVSTATIIKNCYNTGTITGTGNYVGGIAASGGTVTNCYNKGKISSTKNYVGGIVAANETALTNCYNNGAVSGQSFIGGIAGTSMAEMSNCYNSAKVAGTDSVGGVVGYNYSTSTLNYCYWNTDSIARGCGYNNCGTVNITAKTSPEMKSADFVTLLNTSKGSYSSWAASSTYPVFGSTSSNISECLTTSIKVYPNPATNYIVITMESNDNQAEGYSIINIQGELVQAGKIEGKTTIININNIPNGLYCLVVLNKSIRFIKK